MRDRDVCQTRPVNRRPLVIVPVLLAVALAVTALGLGVGSAWIGRGGDAGSQRPIVADPSESAGVPAPSSSAPATPPPSAGPPASPAPSPGPASVPIVPVTGFRATVTSTTRAEVAAVLSGTSKRYVALELVGSETDPILEALGLTPPTDPARLIRAADVATLAADLAKASKRLAFVRADAVTPAVRALAWGGTALFGVDRVRELAEWPLNATLPVLDGASAFDPATTWTLFAGGDILLDRGVYQTVKLRRKGVDFPFNGGTAEITTRYCCSTFGWELPRTRRTGDAGAVRDLIEGADLAIANFENPAPDQPRYHTSGTVFSADPALIEGLANAGIDYVSLANNHIRDAGGAGLLQTIANLTSDGIASSGSGRNLAAARRPGVFTVDGTRVAILAYDAIAAGYHATATRIGSAPLVAGYVREDVKAARAAGADLVIVFPHWGTEYQSKPFAAQQKLARMIIDAGADMVIGNHAHWAAAMEVYKGKPIWYALGNFVFDQTWSEPTMEGITLELTFRGATLTQVRIRPHIILDKAQPNFMDPAGDGKVVMGQVYSASKGLLPW
jgi:poly-gamma-glutamate capsule biosynthesis protein CapA/YwtB (metallophosphatase superfamily)